MTSPGRLRREIPDHYTWDLWSVFASDEDWETEIVQVVRQLDELARFQGHLGDGPAALADWLARWAATERSLGKIYVHSNNRHEVDTTDQVAAGQDDRAGALYARAMASIAFAEPELLGIGFDVLRRWQQKEPRLAVYAHYLDELECRQAHVRSPEVEELLGSVQDPFRAARATHGVLADADLTFQPAGSGAPGAEPRPIAHGTIGALLSSPDRQVRCSAWRNYADAFLVHRNTMANCLAAGVKQDVFMARARRYGSALEAALDENHIPVEVFRSVIAAFRRNLPTWQRYWRVRKQALGYERFHVYDIKAPLSTAMPVVPYAQAMEWVCEGLRPLGDDYVQIVRRGLQQERWVDVYPTEGKRAGAFSTGAPGTSPYVLMSYSDDLYGLSTLAHELGHSLHSHYAWSTQPMVYSHYSIFVAEVASNCNQALVRDYLLRANPDPSFQIALIEEAMSNLHRYLFIMPTLARFELEIHERAERGEALTADSMIALMDGLFREGYGSEVEEDVERIGITWAEFYTHLYSNFYVYQYATGISAAQALAQGMLDGKPGAVERYIAFLKAGASLYPLDALRLAGVDMASSAPVEQAFAYLAQLVERLAGLLGVPADPAARTMGGTVTPA